MPAWWTNNVTAWTPAIDSTPSWNLQRGITNNKNRIHDRIIRLLCPTISKSLCI